MNLKQIFCCHNDEEIDRYYIEQHEHIPFVRFVMPVGINHVIHSRKSVTRMLSKN